MELNLRRHRNGEAKAGANSTTEWLQPKYNGKDTYDGMDVEQRMNVLEKIEVKAILITSMSCVAAKSGPPRRLVAPWGLRLIVQVIIIPLLVGFATNAGGQENSLTYEKDIRPIFRAHCFDCHGATKELKGELDLRLVRSIKAGGESGPAIVPNKPAESLLLERIREGEMPPGENKVTAAEIAVIARWILAGAATARPEPESIGPGLGITLEERSFWSFQPIRRPEMKDVSAFPKTARVRTPIDSLVWSEAGFAPDADRKTLVIRAYIDLTGLPPSYEEVEKWEADLADDWYDRLLTQLLDSPHYGERWARHWLDVAGYADSEGYTNSDAERPWAWKYRDWVIRELNNDKPFDQFITEQLAGDELAGPRNGDLTTEQIGLLTATGFLRMAADGTGSGANNADGRNQVMIDTLKIVGTSLLGMSIQCAQCHDHRYDPIPQTDYYAMRAVFEPALDWQGWKVPNARRISLYTAANREEAAAVEVEAQKVAAEKATKLAEYMKQAIAKEMAKYEEPLRTQLSEAYSTAGNKRTDEQKALLKKYPSVNITTGNLYQYIADSKPKLAEFDKRIAVVRAKKPAEEFIRALVEPPNHAPATKLFHRGDHRQPKQIVTPNPLTVAAPNSIPLMFPLNDESLPSTGRRLAFAKWLTRRDNPLFARVIVNRIWMHHFGKGLVATPADFGKLGVQPTHPEVLDWLADEFISSGWSLKKLHRLIMTSTVWRQVRDPQASFRTNLIRLEAETIRDRMLAATGELDLALFGRPVKIKEDDTGQIVVAGNQTRRTMYVQARRSRPVAMLQSFDAPVMETNCESRVNSTVATQSLMLLNGQFILERAARLANRSAKEAKPLSSEQLAVIPALTKPPTPAWQFGYGRYDENVNRTAQFEKLEHWTGGQWQAGSVLPDPKLGWVLLNSSGGHPDIPMRAVIRRWTSLSDGLVSIVGKLSHGSPNGDGVRGRIVSSRSGITGHWIAHNGAADTNVGQIAVKAGDTIDFITDCRDNQNSDSYSWPTTITFKGSSEPARVYSSVKQFRGPVESLNAVPGQIVRAWQLAYCREPSDEELALAVGFVTRQLDTFAENPAGIPEGRTAVGQAMTNLCQVLLSSNEFLYVH